jgi:subtilisin family serine protease
VYRYRATSDDAPALLAALAADPRVEFAEPNGRVRLLSAPNDPHFPNQWNMRQVRAPEAWDVGTGGADVVVAILDSGIDSTHPDLAGRVVPGRNSRERSANTRDEIGHGTQVAGIVGAAGNNGVGVAGMSWGVRLMPIKITDRYGEASVEAAADGIRWATENGARIINLSLGGLHDSRTLRLAVLDAWSRGVLLVAAAGNCGELASFREEGCDTFNQPIYPAALSEVVAVGALGADDALAPYSNMGSYVRLAAPGGVGGGAPLEHVISTWPAGLTSPLDQPGYSFEVGTSMAAPHVSGAAALLWSTNPTLSRDEVEAILLETADDLGPPGRDDRFGHGRLNVQRALQRAASLPGNRRATIQLSVDAPQSDAILGNRLVVNGWAVDALAEGGTGIDVVEAFLDGPPGQGQPLGRIPYGQARPDVARLLERGGFSNVGFSLTVDVPNGVHTLWIRAHSALSGAWSTQQIRFIAGGPAAPQVSVPSPFVPRGR